MCSPQYTAAQAANSLGVHIEEMIRRIIEVDRINQVTYQKAKEIAPLTAQKKELEAQLKAKTDQAGTFYQTSSSNLSSFPLKQHLSVKSDYISGNEKINAFKKGSELYQSSQELLNRIKALKEAIENEKSPEDELQKRIDYMRERRTPK